MCERSVAEARPVRLQAELNVLQRVRTMLLQELGALTQPTQIRNRQVTDNQLNQLQTEKTKSDTADKKQRRSTNRKEEEIQRKDRKERERDKEGNTRERLCAHFFAPDKDRLV